MHDIVERYFVVGDTFAGTARHLPGILTETEALDKVHGTQFLPADIHLYAQQGVDMRSLTAAVEHFNATLPGKAGQFRLVSPVRAPRATRRLAHKNRAENIVISAPRRIGDQSFEMDLLFSSQNEFFLDHMTGMHIQGMALMEAARQAFLAVTEAYYLHHDDRDYYFVIKRMDVSYTSFVFPFDATLRYDITRISQKNDRHGFDANITIIQAGEVCTTVQVSFTAFEACQIAERERGVADACYQKLLANYAQPQNAASVMPGLA